MLFGWLLTVGPFVLALLAWALLYRSPSRMQASRASLWALSIFTFNAALAAGTYLLVSLRRGEALPPWQDARVLTLAMLLLLTPAGMIAGLIAAGRGATPRWLIVLVEVASVPLLLIGILASNSV